MTFAFRVKTGIDTMILHETDAISAKNRTKTMQVRPNASKTIRQYLILK